MKTEIKKGLLWALILLLATGSAGAAEVKDPPLPNGPYVKAALRCVDGIIRTGKTPSTSDTRECWRIQAGKALRKLDADQQSFLKDKSQDTQVVIESAQKAWKTYAFAHCSLYGKLYEGSIWHAAPVQCYLKKIEGRLKELDEIQTADQPVGD